MSTRAQDLAVELRERFRALSRVQHGPLANPAPLGSALYDLTEVLAAQIAAMESQIEALGNDLAYKIDAACPCGGDHEPLYGCTPLLPGVTSYRIPAQTRLGPMTIYAADGTPTRVETCCERYERETGAGAVGCPAHGPDDDRTGVAVQRHIENRASVLAEIVRPATPTADECRLTCPGGSERGTCKCTRPVDCRVDGNEVMARRALAAVKQPRADRDCPDVTCGTCDACRRYKGER